MWSHANPGSRAISALQASAPYPPPIPTPLGSPPLPPSWLRTGSQACALKSTNSTIKGVSLWHSFGHSPFPEQPHCICCKGAPQVSCIGLDLTGERGPPSSSGLSARTPSQSTRRLAPRSCSCTLPPPGDTMDPTLLSLLPRHCQRLKTVLTGAQADRANTNAHVHMASEIHTGSGTQQTHSQEQRHLLALQPIY